MSLTGSSTTFYDDEIHRALEEQSFGVQTFSIIETHPLHARASITLLEGSKITIRLDPRGYLIEPGPEVPLTNKENIIFDYIDSLLQSVSPKYEVKRHEIWVRKLESLLPVG